MPKFTHQELKEQALALTSLYETSKSAPDCFGRVAGNFDGAGLSFGAIQFNFKSGSLQPILKDLINNYPSVVKTAFNYSSNSYYYNTLVDVVFNRSTSSQISWGDSISSSTNKSNLVSPWGTYFYNLGITQQCIDRQIQQTAWYYSQAERFFADYDFYSCRAYALCFDIAVQNGSISSEVKSLVLNDIAKLNENAMTREEYETEKMLILANRRADAVTARWREVVRERKVTIAEGYGYVHGGSLLMDTNAYGMNLDPAFVDFETPLPPTQTVGNGALKIYIDPLYGGTNTGNTATDGTTGKSLTLDIGLKLRNIILNKYVNATVMMSRTSDITKTEAVRLSEANRFGADIIVRVGVNYSTTTSTRGFTSFATNDYTTPPKSDFDYIRKIIHEGIMDYVEWSVDLGRQNKSSEFLDGIENSYHIETYNGYLSNADDLALLKDDSFRTKIAEGHAFGIAQAFKQSKGFGLAWSKVNKSENLFGVDISHYQSPVNWSTLASKGVKWAIFRAVGSDHGTYDATTGKFLDANGNLFMDASFRSFVANSKMYNIPFGTYYFATPPLDMYDDGTFETAIRQANHYADILEEVIGSFKWGDLYPFLDFENYNNSQTALTSAYATAWIKKFREVFLSRIPTRLGLYTGWSFVTAMNNFDGDDVIAKMPLWIANYTYRDDPFNNRLIQVGEWDDWTIWQYGDNVIVPSEWGVATDRIDMNYLKDLVYLKKPSAPQNVNVSVSTNDNVKVTWHLVNDKDIDRYQIKKTDSKGTTTWFTINKNINAWEDTNVVDGETYYYKVIAYDKFDDFTPSAEKSVRYTPITQRTRPNIPQNVVLTEGEKKITVTWDAPANEPNLLGYNIYINGLWLKWLNAGFNSFTITNLPNGEKLVNGETYTIEIDARSTDYSQNSFRSLPLLGVPYQEIPNVPYDVNASIQENKDVILTWKHDPSLVFSHYAIAVNGEIVEAQVDEKTITLSDLAINETQIINVIATNIKGTQSWSANLQVTIKVPQKPSALIGTPKDKKILMVWNTNNESFVKGYNVYINDLFHEFTTDTFFEFTDQTVIGGYREPIENGMTYKVSVRAISEYTNIVSEKAETTIIPVKIYPNPPTYLTTEVLAENEVKVSWQHKPKEQFSHFKVELNDEVIADNITDHVYNIVQEFVVRTDYKVKVISVDTDGDEMSSVADYFVINKPSIPSNITLKPLDRQIKVNWKRNEETFVTGYNIYLDGVFYKTTTINEMFVTGLENDISYNIQVEAVGEQFNSIWSDIQTTAPIIDIPFLPRVISHEVLGTGGVELTIDHTQKVDHDRYEVYLNGNAVPVGTSKGKKIITTTLNANERHTLNVQAFDKHNDGSGWSQNYYVEFSSETLDEKRENMLRLGEINYNIEPVQPQIKLCKPNMTTIAVLDDVYNMHHTVRLGDLNQLQFSMPFMIDVDGVLVENPNIDKLKERYLIKMELNDTTEYYVITNISDKSNATREVREVDCYSLGFELANFQIRDYEKTGYAKEVLEEVLAETSWQISTNLLDEGSFFNKHSDNGGSGGRTFEISSKTVLDFVKEVAEAFSAIILWDTETRSLDFVQSENLGENKGLTLSYDRYLREVAKEVDTNQMVTHLMPLGENNMTIRSINPTQSSYIEDFSFFLHPFEMDELGNVVKSSHYMTDGLAKAIVNFRNKIESHQGNYSTLYHDKLTLEVDKKQLENQLFDIETELDIATGREERLKLQDALIRESFEYNALPVTKEVKLDKDQYYTAFVKVSSTEELTIDFQGTTVPVEPTVWTMLGKYRGEKMEDTLTVLFDGLGYEIDVELIFVEIIPTEFETNGNEQELMDKYVVDLTQLKFDSKEAEINAKQSDIDLVQEQIDTIVNDLTLSNNFTEEELKERKLFIITKEWSNPNINNENELYEQAIKEFEELRNPKIQITMDIVNFLELVEGQNDWNKLVIGDIITIYDERIHVDYKAKILEINFSYDDKQIKLTIANADEIKDDEELFMESLYKAVSTSTTVEAKRHEWDRVKENSKEIQTWLDDEFDATKKTIIAGTNESIEISKRGLLIKDKNDPFNFLTAQHKVIAITNDGGKTYKNAITTRGVIAERLVGRIVAGENLIIENEDGSFKIDRNGITVKSFALKIEGGIDERSLGIDTSGLRANYEDYNVENINNATTPTSPVIEINGTAIDHKVREDGTVDISFTFTFDDEGVEGDIDGFMLFIHASSVSNPYEFGSTPSREIRYMLNPQKRSVILRNVSANLYYSFGIQSYRVVDETIDASGVLTSPIIKPLNTIENPYHPYVNVGIEGDILATVERTRVAELNETALNTIRQGVSYNNVTIDANSGLVVKNSRENVMTVMNATEGISIFTKASPLEEWERRFYVDQNGQLTAEKLMAKAIEITDNDGNKIIDANEGVLNLSNLQRIEGQDMLTGIVIGSETIFESGYNPRELGTLTMAESPVWDESGIYHGGNGFGLHLHVDGDVLVNSTSMYSSGTNSGTILIKRKDTGEEVHRQDVTLVDGRNDIYLGVSLKEEIGDYWIGVEGAWTGAGVWRSTDTVITFPYLSGDFIIDHGGLYDSSSGTTFYYYFYDFLLQGEGVEGYIANDKLLNAIRVKGTTTINGNYIQTGTVDADKLNVKGLEVRNAINETTFSISSNGDTTIRGNIYMEGGSILWGLDPNNQDTIRGFAWLTDTDGISRLYIDADDIRTGTMSFDHAQGGTLIIGGTELAEVDELGQPMFSNGILSFKNSRDEEVARFDGDYRGFKTLRIDRLTDTTNVVFKTDGNTFHQDTLNENGIYEIYTDAFNGRDDIDTIGTKTDPFKTIQEVINRLPKYLDREIIIYFVPCILADTNIEFQGFVGNGRITVKKMPNFVVRYIRDWTNGSTANTSNHTVEIRAVQESGSFVGGGTLTTNGAGTNLTNATNGNTDSSDYVDNGSNNGEPVWIHWYTGGGYTTIEQIIVWHYYTGGRTYYGTKTEVSEDNNKWYTIFDSAVNGTYAETSDGHEMFVNRATLNGTLDVWQCGVEIQVYDMVVNGAYSNSPTVYARNSTRLNIDNCIVLGDGNYAYAVYANSSFIRIIRSEVNTAKTAGIIGAYGAKVEIADTVGSGYPYGHYAHSGSVVGGGGKGLLGTSKNVHEYWGGLVAGTWTHEAGKFSPITITKRQITKTWGSTASQSWNEGSNSWHTADNDVLQGKWDTWGKYIGCWFFGSDIRNTLTGSTVTDIKQIRVYFTRANSSGYVNDVTHYVRYHNHTSKPSGKPSYSSAYKTVVLDRGQSVWLDVTSQFKSAFLGGSACGISLYTTSTSGSYYSRCNGYAKIEVTYEVEETTYA